MGLSRWRRGRCEGVVRAGSREGQRAVWGGTAERPRGHRGMWREALQDRGLSLTRLREPLERRAFRVYPER